MAGLATRLERLEVWQRRLATEAGRDAVRACLDRLSSREIATATRAERRRRNGEALSEDDRHALERWEAAFTDERLTDALRRLSGTDRAAGYHALARIIVDLAPELRARWDWGRA